MSPVRSIPTPLPDSLSSCPAKTYIDVPMTKPISILATSPQQERTQVISPIQLMSPNFAEEREKRTSSSSHLSPTPKMFGENNRGICPVRSPQRPRTQQTSDNENDTNESDAANETERGFQLRFPSPSQRDKDDASTYSQSRTSKIPPNDETESSDIVTSKENIKTLLFFEELSPG